MMLVSFHQSSYLARGSIDLEQFAQSHVVKLDGLVLASRGGLVYICLVWGQ
jgi:hypothetical protein